MSVARRAAARLLPAAELANWRAEADDRVGSRADIIGSMLGVKLRRGQPTGRMGFTYLVRQKVAIEELAPKGRIPARVKVGKRSIATDVLAWPRMVEQAALQPTIISDGPSQGSLSCFGRSSTGEWLGVSCAHCLVGSDGNPVTPTDVRYWETAKSRWFDAGRSRYLAYAPGAGVPGNFGFLDCGLIGLRDPSLVQRAQVGAAVATVASLHELLNQTLVGYSALRAGSAGPQRRALVIGVEKSGLDELADVVLQVEAPGTFGGDSGMLWLTQQGKAAAIHARGEIVAGLGGSSLTAAMSASRVASALGVQLVLG